MPLVVPGPLVAVVALVLHEASEAQVFDPPALLPSSSGVSATGPVVAGDLDGDGDPDLVCVGSNGYGVWLGDGASGFVEQPLIASTAAPFSALLADLDGDERLDLVVGSLTGTWYLLGDGLGGFGAETPVSTLSSYVAIGDLDADGLPDIVQTVAGSIEAHLNQGGTFGPPIVSSTTVTTGVLAIGDLDGDGFEDLVIGGLFSPGAALFGDGTGGFAGERSLGLSGTSLRLLDFDADDDLDLLLAGLTPLTCLRNDGAGNLGSPLQIANESGAVLAADLDADGEFDIALLGGTSTDFRWFRGLGGGSFAAQGAIVVGNRSAFVAGDWDLDGRTDVMMTVNLGPAPPTLALLHNRTNAFQGTSVHGTGTPGCLGAVGIAGTRVPNQGAADFRVVCSNAPPLQLGLVAIGARDLAGSDPFQLGLLLHIDTSLLHITDVLRSDASGVASYSLPIAAGLAGGAASVQSFWLSSSHLGQTCSAAQFDLVSSRALRILVQP